MTSMLSGYIPLKRVDQKYFNEKVECRAARAFKFVVFATTVTVVSG